MVIAMIGDLLEFDTTATDRLLPQPVTTHRNWLKAFASVVGGLCGDRRFMW